MQNNVRAAREISEGRTAEYSSTLWADVPVSGGPPGGYVTFPDIVRAAIVGRAAAFSTARQDLARFSPPDYDPMAVEILAAWFLDYGFFRFSLDQGPVAKLFGDEPTVVTEDMAAKLAVAGAQFLCGYEESDKDKRLNVVPFAALTIKESMWGGPLPEEWLS
jgi:hypothetical protein